jgi:NAD dependent epimerase/dehydratase family enzyme
VTMPLRVTITGATGLIGSRLVTALQVKDADVTVLSRNPKRAEDEFGASEMATPVEAVKWDLLSEPAPAEALAGRDAVVHLAGENVAQRWTGKAKRAIRASRVTGTRNLLAGLGQAEPRPRLLISASATGYYGAHGEEPLDEDAPAGNDFLAEVCAQVSCSTAKAERWERC